MIPARFVTGKAAVDFHPFHQDKAYLRHVSVGFRRWLVGSFRHPDFVAGLRIFQCLLQVGVGIFPTAAVLLASGRLVYVNNIVGLISADINGIADDPWSAVQIGNGARGNRAVVPRIDRRRTCLQVQISLCRRRLGRINILTKAWIHVEIVAAVAGALDAVDPALYDAVSYLW